MKERILWVLAYLSLLGLFAILYNQIDKVSKNIEVVEEKIKEITRPLKTVSEYVEKEKVKKGKLFVKTEYSVDQALVYQKMGEPDRKVTKPVTQLELKIYILRPSSPILTSPCYRQTADSFSLNYPPKVEIWIYNEDDNKSLAIIFVSSFSGLDNLVLREDLKMSEIFQILIKLCEFPQDLGNFRQISTIRGDRKTVHSLTAEGVLHYLFTRLGRTRIPLGMETLAENAKTM